MKNFAYRAALALAFGAAASAAWSDVVYLKDGRILIGSLEGAKATGVTYSVGGSELTFKADSILRTERESSALKGSAVEVRLKDASLLKGRVADYDSELGLFVEVAFGTLLIPQKDISQISVPGKNPAADSGGVALRVGGGAYAPVLGGSGFGPSWKSAFGADWKLPFGRGFSAGVALACDGAAYSGDGAKYGFFSARPEIAWKYRGLEEAGGALARLAPFVSFCAGPAYVSVKDPESTPSAYGEMVAEAGIAGGIEIAAWAGSKLRLEACADAYAQKGTPMVALGVLASLAYGR